MTEPVFIITGAMAAGKSTIAKALAQRFNRAAYVEGDAFLRMIVRGEAVMGPVLDADARAQLSLRQQAATDSVRRFAEAGFAVVYEDILIGDDLRSAVDRLSDFEPRVVVLTPSADVLAQRDRDRPKTGYSDNFSPSVLAEALVRETPRIGLWLDSSEMSVEQVIDAILAPQ
ncbi:MAG: AAA family ATPase [Devosia sp.]|uniref:AAA family ATPase n=1 Tax=Devosia sp. TaxID=1871048 RepID=UPI0024CBA5E7|nr:AAA family ATPase [Devosia sp.]UYN99856.1 MAG: AAA family ATPase [Devosia sp.]